MFFAYVNFRKWYISSCKKILYSRGELSLESSVVINGEMENKGPD